MKIVNLFFIFLFISLESSIYCINQVPTNSQSFISTNFRNLKGDSEDDFDQLFRILVELNSNPSSVASGITCSTANCPKDQGKCKNASTCECYSGWINPVGKDKQAQLVSGKFCSYHQRRQLTAFLLEFFLSFGIGHLYAHRFPEGCIKFTLASLVCIFLLALKLINKGVFIENQTPLSYVMLTFTTFMCCAFVGWQFVDLIMFGMNKFPDGNNMPLEPW